MTDPYRYLPCALHEALALGLNERGHHYVLGTPTPPDERGSRHYPATHYVDLATGPGWDHAVRALAAIKGTELLESSSVAFDDEFRVPGVERFVFSEHPPRGATLMWTKRASTSPAARREALCRCICAALNLRVEEVFP